MKRKDWDELTPAEKQRDGTTLRYDDLWRHYSPSAEQLDPVFDAIERRLDRLECAAGEPRSSLRRAVAEGLRQLARMVDP